ncbi:PhoPQ-activated pathogenicity-related family protein [Phenylobacterium sp.]|uniref:PhoPQ-activated pathogenicity-related family protein n=1 Tax=Phenylobacterium sp. TaxID=1871053 RepID=UPI002ED98FCE
MPRLFRALAAAMLVLVAPAMAQPTAVDAYVARKDPAYAWRLEKTIPGETADTYVLELTSQTWRSAAEVDRPVWKHWLTIVKPHRLRSSTGLLVIGGGASSDPAPAKASDRTLRIATSTGTVVAELGMVPNQPLRFTDSPDRPRVEDDIIAYTRVKHFSTKDDTWLVRLAMVKSGTAALDAVQAFLASDAGGKTKVDRFVVSGGSKRGWTAWLVAATDARVTAVVPLVIDALNSEKITRHHFEALGFFSSALDDYVEHGLFPHKIGTPEYRAVLAIEDPYNYRQRPRMQMPKFLINASGDQFFLPDNSRFYYRDLAGEKHIRYVPNARHDLAGSDAVESLIAFHDAVAQGRLRPVYAWEMRADGAFIVRPRTKPREVRLWQANNPKARDFRLDVIGPAYTSAVLQPRPDGTYVADAPKPASGFTAYFVEMTFDSGGPFPFKFTTEVAITPDTLPFKWEDAAKRYPRRP